MVISRPISLINKFLNKYLKRPIPSNYLVGYAKEPRCTVSLCFLSQYHEILEHVFLLVVLFIGEVVWRGGVEERRDK